MTSRRSETVQVTCLHRHMTVLPARCVPRITACCFSNSEIGGVAETRVGPSGKGCPLLWRSSKKRLLCPARKSAVKLTSRGRYNIWHDRAGGYAPGESASLYGWTKLVLPLAGRRWRWKDESAKKEWEVLLQNQ